MLKLTLKPGDYIDIGTEVKVVFSGGSANNIHVLVEAPKEMNIARSSARGRKKSSYYAEKGISKEAQKEIVSILRREHLTRKADSSRCPDQTASGRKTDARSL